MSSDQTLTGALLPTLDQLNDDRKTPINFNVISDIESESKADYDLAILDLRMFDDYQSVTSKAKYKILLDSPTATSSSPLSSTRSSTEDHDSEVNRHNLPIRIGRLMDHIVTRLSDPKQIGPYRFNPGARTLVKEGGFKEEGIKESGVKEDAQSMPLTEKEAAALVYILENGPVNRNDLLRDIWLYSEGIETHTIESHIYRLRQKIEDDPANPQILITTEDGYAIKKEH